MSSTPHPAAGVAAVILAAGESRRFGSPKQLAELNGRTLLAHVLERAFGAGLDPVVAVVPAWFDPSATTARPISWVHNSHPERGMSESLKLGFGALPESAEAAVILLGDAPWYGRFGFSAAKTANLWLPGAFERERLLGLELSDSALDGACGMIIPTGAALARRAAKPRRQGARAA